MSDVSPITRILACFVISLLLFAGSEAVVSPQEPESGASAESTEAPRALDDAFQPIDVGEQINPNLIDPRETAAVLARADTPSALWERLTGFNPEQRTNARIELELGSAATNADRDAAGKIAALWNGGDHERALAELQDLERTGAAVALGISWQIAPGSSMAMSPDGRIGLARTDAQTMSIDYDAQSGHAFAVVRWGSTTGTSAWTVNRSTDGGITWSESYSFASSAGIVDVDAVVAAGYVYVAYVAGNAANEARIRRCLTSTGGVDGSYGFHVVFDAGANSVEEVALASNADAFDNRIYYAVIQNNDVLRYAFDVASDGTTFSEQSPAGSNPEFGLDMTWDNAPDSCGEFLYLSYSGNDGNIHVRGRRDSAWTDWTVQTGAGASRRTAVSARGDSIICAFEYPYSPGTGIRYGISYDCGATWSPGSLAVPDGSTVFGYFEPDVDARDADGLAIIYQAEAGAFDPLYYRTRAGFAPGAWSDPVIFNDFDIYTGSETSISYLPPLAGEAFSHGAMYISLDPDFRTPYFDRPLSSGPICGDVTPPIVRIDSPGGLECACNSVDITGAVDDPEGTYVRDQLEIRRRGTAGWVEVDTMHGARSGSLYTWDTTGLAQDYYNVRIVAENECGLRNSDSTFVYMPGSFDDLELSEPRKRMSHS